MSKNSQAWPGERFKMDIMNRRIFKISNLLPLFFALMVVSSAAAAGGAESILAEITAAAPENRGAAYEKLGRYIAAKDLIEPRENAALESALNLMIESDIRDAGAHAAAGELCLKNGSLRKAYYHFEMAVMADPYNFHARRKMNEVKKALAPETPRAPVSNGTAPSPAAPLPAPLNSAAAPAEDEEDEITADDGEKLSSTIKSNLPAAPAREIEFGAPEAAGAQECKKNACYYITKKQYSRAEEFALRALEQEPADNEANYLMAYIKNKRKKNEDAFGYLNMINPETLNDAKLLHDAGMLLVRLKKNEEAVAFFTSGIACDRAYLENYISLAVHYTQIKDHDSAAKYFKEAMSVAPKDLKLLYYYALACNKAGRYEEFIALADRLLQISPDGAYAKMIKRRLGLIPTDRLISGDNEKTLLNVAIEYFNAGDYGRAESKLKEIIRINPDSFDANLYLAKSSKNKGKTVEYAYYLARLESAKPNIAIELELGRAFATLGLNVLSREYYLKYINKNSGDVAVRLEYAAMLKEKGAFVSAGVIGESIIRNAKSAEEAAAVNLALAEINGGGEGDTDESGFNAVGAGAAENLYKLCLMLHENEMYRAVESIGDILSANKCSIDARVLEMYAVSLAALKKYNRAVDAYKFLISMDRGNYNAYVQLGKIYLKRNNFVRAEEYFRAASVFRPGDAEILMLLGDSCYYQKNADDAEIAYQEALERAPNAVVREEVKLKLEKIKFSRRAR